MTETVINTHYGHNLKCVFSDVKQEVLMTFADVANSVGNGTW